MGWGGRGRGGEEEEGRVKRREEESKERKDVLIDSFNNKSVEDSAMSFIPPAGVY